MIVRQETTRVLKYVSLIVGYAVLIYAAFVCAYFFRFYGGLIPLFKELPPFLLYQNAIIVIVFLWLVLFLQSGFFDAFSPSPVDDLVTIIRVVSIGTLLALTINFFYRDYLYSRLVILFGWLFTIVLLFLFHQVLRFIRRFMHIKRNSSRRILLIGGGKIAKLVKKRTQQQFMGRQYFYPHQNQYDQLTLFLEKKKITDVIVTAEYGLSRDVLLMIADICEQRNILFKFIPDILELRMGEVTVDNEIGLPILQIKPVSFLEANFIKKRLFDLVVAMSILTVLIIPILYIAFLIKITSKGSMIYKQKRVGLRGKQFDFYKFRTMIMGADAMMDRLKHLSERDGPVFKMRKDPRIMLIGSLLRKYSIDELPQLYNVLRGDMSMIGPRPQVVWETQHYDDVATRRLSVLPGITGIWQISGRSELSYEEMISLDIYYIENWSLSLDLRILLNTIPAVSTSKGAY